VLADPTSVTQADIVAFADRSNEVFTPVPPDKLDARPDSVRERAWRRQREPEVRKA
jgi:hypothetical protein